MRIRQLLALLGLLAPLPLAGAAGQAVPSVPPADVTLGGRVVSDSTNEPIEGAVVFLLGTRFSVRTDAAGRFRLTVPEGTYVLQARAISHETASLPLTVKAGQVLDVDITLASMGYVLPEITVVGEAKDGAVLSPKLAGFYRRMKENGGFGTFVTPEMLNRRNPVFASDVLRNVPGAMVTCGQRTMGAGCTVRLQRMMGTGFSRTDCPPLVFLDGVELRGVANDLDNIVPAAQLQAVEVYRGQAGMPAEFNRPGSSCGVILFWTGSR